MLLSISVRDFNLSNFVLQSNEVQNSYGMELEGLKRCLAYLEEEEITVCSLVTDRHSQIKKYLKDTHPEINHMFDVWHVAKGMLTCTLCTELQIHSNSLASTLSQSMLFLIL